MTDDTALVLSQVDVLPDALSHARAVIQQAYERRDVPSLRRMREQGLAWQDLGQRFLILCKSCCSGLTVTDRSVAA